MQTGDARTITGSGFGSTGPTLLAWDTFDGGVNGNAITAPQYGSYENSYAVYSNTVSHSGSLCAKHPFGAGNEFKPIDVSLLGSLKHYLSWWYYMTGNVTTGQVKLCQIWGDNYIGNYAPGFLWGSATNWWWSAIMREDEDYYLMTDMTAGETAGTWYHMELLIRESSAANVANGQIDFRINGELQTGSHNNIVTRTTSRVMGEAHIGDGHTNPTSGYIALYTDELIVQNGWARVVLGNANTYAGSSLTVPQRVTSWGATAIEYVVFKGALTGDDVWEFVIDDTNAVVKTTALSWTGNLLAGPANLRWRPV